MSGRSTEINLCRRNDSLNRLWPADREPVIYVLKFVPLCSASDNISLVDSFENSQVLTRSQAIHSINTIGRARSLIGSLHTQCIQHIPRNDSDQIQRAPLHHWHSFQFKYSRITQTLFGIQIWIPHSPYRHRMHIAQTGAPNMFDDFNDFFLPILANSELLCARIIDISAISVILVFSVRMINSLCRTFE